jgi:hypothetical protein
MTDGDPSYFEMDDAFCTRMRLAIEAGLESAPIGVVTTPIRASRALTASVLTARSGACLKKCVMAHHTLRFTRKNRRQVCAFGREVKQRENYLVVFHP